MHESEVAVLKYLQHNQPATVKEISENIHFAQNVVSERCKQLHEAGVLEYERVRTGKRGRYSRLWRFK